MNELDVLNELQVDFLLLADRAEAANGKLFVMGGGWEQIGIQDFQQPMSLSFAVAVTVPWNATNRQHTLSCSLETSDRVPVAEFRVELGFVVGRPPQMVPGESQRVLLAAPGIPVRLPGAGTYELRADLNGKEARRTKFKALQIPMAVQQSG